MTMGHEYVHVSHYINIPNFTGANTEWAAYQWNIDVMNRLGGQDKQIEIYNKNQQIYRANGNGIPDSYYKYGSWGIPTSWPFW